MRPKRIVKVPICHVTVFERLVAGLHQAKGTTRSHGCEWRLAWAEDGVEIYERADHGLAWLRASVDDYERVFYRVLAAGVVGGDGFLRRRTASVTKDPTGSYRSRNRG